MILVGEWKGELCSLRGPRGFLPWRIRSVSAKAIAFRFISRSRSRTESGLRTHLSPASAQSSCCVTWRMSAAASSRLLLGAGQLEPDSRRM